MTTSPISTKPCKGCARLGCIPRQLPLDAFPWCEYCDWVFSATWEWWTDHRTLRLGEAQILVCAVLLTAACGDLPTAPTPPPPIQIAAVTPAPVASAPVAPPVVTAPSFPPNDPRWDLAFYRTFAHGGGFFALRHATEAPRIYLRTVDDGGTPMDALTLDQTAAALVNVTGQLTGAFGVDGLERGTGTREGQPGWKTVRWSTMAIEQTPTYSVCGEAHVGGDVLTFYPRSKWCRCSGGPAVVLTIVKHEMGHILGFYHTDDPNDLMYPASNACDKPPSAREMYHAAVAYSRPNGSPSP